VNAVLFELPYHLQRRPRRPGAINNFISEDLLRMVEATRQSIADVRALMKWLRGQGCEKIGLWGTSLGAWLAGLIVCHEPKLDFAVLATPIAKLERVIKELAFCAPIRRSYEKSNLSLSKLNLAQQRPKIALDKILIQEAEHDLFAPKETVEEFWADWGRPEIWRARHGHISILMSVSMMNRTVKWIAAKAEASL
jgi:dienelactone hydrolase